MAEDIEQTECLPLVDTSNSEALVPGGEQDEQDEQDDGPFCRFCGNQGCPDDELVVPCNCKGSVGHVHQSCLRIWLQRSGSRACEICRYRFRWRRSVRDICTWEVVRAVLRVFRTYLKLCVPRGLHLAHHFGSIPMLPAYLILSLPLLVFLAARWWDVNSMALSWQESIKYAAIVLVPTMLSAMYFVSVSVDLRSYILPAVLRDRSLEWVAIGVFIAWTAGITLLRFTLLPEPGLRTRFRDHVEHPHHVVALPCSTGSPSDESNPPTPPPPPPPPSRVSLYLPLDTFTLANCLLGPVVHCLLIHVPLLLLCLGKSVQVVVLTRVYRWEVQQRYECD